MAAHKSLKGSARRKYIQLFFKNNIVVSSMSSKMASVFNNSKPLMSIEILIKERVCLVRDVDVDSLLPVLEHFLLYTEIDAIKACADQGAKTRELIDCLQRRTVAGSYEAFNAFMRILGGTQPELFTKLVGRCPTDIEADFCVEGFTSELKKVVKAKGHSTDSPLDEQIDLDSQHVQLQIIETKAEDRDFARTDTEDLYSPYEHHHHRNEAEDTGKIVPLGQVLKAGKVQAKRILMSGRAGVGKTTSLQWLSRQWALNKWAAEFTMLFLLQLRMLSNTDTNMTVVELLLMYGLFQLTTENSQKVLSAWLKNARSRIVVLIDGVDEISGFSHRFKNSQKITDLNQRAHPIDLCINILRGDLLPGCTLICTSRPFTGLSVLMTDTALEILGLTQNQVKEFVRIKHPQKARQIMSVLNRNPILMSVCGITFYCMAVSTLLSEGIEMLDEDVQTYTRLTAFILVQYMSRKLSNLPFVIEVNSFFSKLAFLAHKGIFLSGSNGIAKLTFDEYDLAGVKLSPSKLDLIRKTGILQIKDFRIGSRNSLSAEFLHLTMQEMLAVAHVISNPVISKGTLKRIFHDGQFNMALMYMFGLYYDKDSDWIKDVCKAVSPSEVCAEKYIDSYLSGFVKQLSIFAAKGITSDRGSADRLNVCQLIHEGHVEDLAKCVVDNVIPNGRLKVMHTPMTAIDLIAVSFVCQYSHTLTHINLSGVNADDTFMKVLSSSLITPHVNSLQFLYLMKNNIRAEGTKALAEIVQQSGCLDILSLSGNHIGGNGAKILAEALHTNNSLKVLNVSDNDIDDYGAKALAEALHTNTSLQMLNVSDNDIGDYGVKALAEALHTNNSLQSLIVSDILIGEASIKALKDVLYSKASLHQLVVSGKEFLDPTKATLRELKTNNSILSKERSGRPLIVRLKVIDLNLYLMLFSIAKAQSIASFRWMFLVWLLCDGVLAWLYVVYFTWMFYFVYISYKNWSVELCIF